MPSHLRGDASNETRPQLMEMYQNAWDVFEQRPTPALVWQCGKDLHNSRRRCTMVDPLKKSTLKTLATDADTVRKEAPSGDDGLDQFCSMASVQCDLPFHPKRLQKC